MIVPATDIPQMPVVEPMVAIDKIAEMSIATEARKTALWLAISLRSSSTHSALVRGNSSTFTLHLLSVSLLPDPRPFYLLKLSIFQCPVLCTFGYKVSFHVFEHSIDLIDHPLVLFLDSIDLILFFGEC